MSKADDSKLSNCCQCWDMPLLCLLLTACTALTELAITSIAHFDQQMCLLSTACLTLGGSRCACYHKNNQILDAVEGGEGSADLVYEVDLGVGCEVPQKVHGAVQMVHGGHFTPHTVVEPPRTVVVDKTVAHPQS